MELLAKRKAGLMLLVGTAFLQGCGGMKYIVGECPEPPKFELPVLPELDRKAVTHDELANWCVESTITLKSAVQQCKTLLDGYR